MVKRCIMWVIFFIIGSCSLTTWSQVFSDQNGVPIQIEKFPDKLVLFVYLSPECHFCRKEVLALNELAEIYPDKVVILGANQEEFTPTELQKFRLNWNIAFAMLQQDPTEFLQLKSVNMVPTMVIMKPDGRVLAPIVGLRSRKQLERILFNKT